METPAPTLAIASYRHGTHNGTASSSLARAMLGRCVRPSTRLIEARRHHVEPSVDPTALRPAPLAGTGVSRAAAPRSWNVEIGDLDLDLPIAVSHEGAEHHVAASFFAGPQEHVNGPAAAVIEGKRLGVLPCLGR